VAKTVADMLVERLLEWGVDTVFGLPGDGVNGLFEALRTHRDQIRFVQVGHEEAAAFAACGYAKFAGRLGVCLATSGPGGLHLLNGLYDAKMDGQPVLAITGHTFHDLIGTHYQQDVDLNKVFMDVSAYNERVMGPTHVVSVVDEAVKVALARHTVTHVSIPKDTQDWTLAEGGRSPANIAEHSGDVFAPVRPLPPEAELRQAADLINQGARVAILAGRGCLGATSELLELADRAAAPIVKPLLGKGVCPDDSPFTTGGIGLLGTAPSADAMKECDTLVMLGTAFPYLEFYPQPGDARGIQVDIDASSIGMRYPVELGLVGTCRDVIRALLPMVERKRDRRFLEKAQQRMNELMERRGTRADTPLKPQVVAYEVNKLVSDDAIVVADTGTVTTWAARHIQMRGTMQFSASGMLASMANAVAYAVGAAFGNPDRQVVCLAGDGGVSMLMGEMATLAKYHLPVKLIVFKNNLLGMIKWEQLVLEGNPQYGVELQPIDFAAVGLACGIAGFSADDPAGLREVLHQAFAHDGPAIVQAAVDPNEPPLPGKITSEQAWHFAKALARGERDRFDIIRTVIEDKVREVI
jgi:pyruvate dehydrogenase (quinone)